MMKTLLGITLYLTTIACGQQVEVDTKYGVVVGHAVELTSGTTINSFLGIPYAKPPTGDLRWQVSDFL